MLLIYLLITPNGVVINRFTSLDKVTFTLLKKTLFFFKLSLALEDT